VVCNCEQEEVPPFACMEMVFEFESGNSATEDDLGELRVKVRKPTSDAVDNPTSVLFNGPIPIAPESDGEGFLLLRTLALVDLLVDISPGSTVGPVDGEWALGSSGTGFDLITYDASRAYEDGDLRTAVVAPASGGESASFDLYKYTLTSDMAPGFLGAASFGGAFGDVRSLTSNIQDTTVRIFDEVATAAHQTIGDIGLCLRDGVSNRYYVIEPDCDFTCGGSGGGGLPPIGNTPVIP
jgi:hypothetical protein